MRIGTAFTSVGTGDSSAVMMKSSSLSTNVRKRVARKPESIDHSAATSCIISLLQKRRLVGLARFVPGQALQWEE